MDKKSSRRLLSKGRVLTQEDVDRLKLAQKEYKEGTSLLELNPVEDFGNKLIWKGALEECSGKLSNWPTLGVILRP
ncbi:uncharacterized protein K441DRAFT_671672 [Cenococcum geophilum 1.58]|uniref:Uncharacterized protein n=1 Tax=Cenococcum geophilum 1.58 TaxID=794803 RepID=A0ACC8EMT2_9PEZI|nr:hypothetical protein K441DRAFT_671672 [Cenococcum geophilum 1.58]